MTIVRGRRVVADDGDILVAPGYGEPVTTPAVVPAAG
jgi:hypothetical protein